MTLKELIKTKTTTEEKKTLDKIFDMALRIKKHRKLRKIYKEARRNLD